MAIIKKSKVKLSAQDDMSSEQFDKKTKKKSLQDKMNRAPEFNKGLRKKFNAVAV